MRRHSLALLGLGVCAGFASAQGGPIPPGMISPIDTLSPIFQQSWLTTNTDVYIANASPKYVAQASSNVFFNNTPGTWAFHMTIYGLNSNYGNTSSTPGFQGVVMGTYDQIGNTWKPNTLGNAMNQSGGGAFGLMISGDIQGTMAVVDWSDGVYFSRRATATVAFPAPVKVSGVVGTYVDPAVAKWQGKDMLLWVEAYSQGGLNLSRIRMQELDIQFPTSVALKGTPITVADVIRTHATEIKVHSPTPIMGRDGRVHALWMSEEVGGSDSDQYFKADLRVAKGHEQVLTFDNPQWYNNGAVPGGRIFAANSGSTGGFYNGLHQADVAWLVGDELDINTSGEFIGGMWDTNTGPNVTVVFLSAGYLPVAGGVTVPGFKGKFGLDLTTLFVFGTMAHTDASQRATMPVGIPNDPNFKGKSFNLQGLSIDPGAPNVQVFTNTAWLNIN